MIDYKDKITKVVDSIDLGKPIFNVIVSNRRINVNPIDWSTNLDNSNFTEQLVNSYTNRHYNPKDKCFFTRCEETIESISQDIVHNIADLFIRCSPYDKPRRTKIFKQFTQTVRQNRHNERFINDLYNICEYHWNVTRTDSIDHKNNDVHRKNIYSLLCLMEKSYGKKSSN